MTVASPTTVPRLRWKRIIPVAVVMYTISFMDRINVGFATHGMERAFHVGPSIVGLILGTFFLGYLVLQLLGGYWAETRSAKQFVFWLLIIWGVFAVLSGLAQTLWQELAARFLLGVAEGGIWPATLVLLARWFPRQERARANGWWLICLPLGAALTAPISGVLLASFGWRTMLVLEGIPPLIWAAVWWWGIADRPSEATWLSERERIYLTDSIQRERDFAGAPASPWSVLVNPVVWLLAFTYFLTILGGYGLNLWAPAIVRALGVGALGTGLLLTIPNVRAIALLVYAGHLSDRTGRRAVIAAGTLLISLSGYLLLGAVGTSVVGLAVVFLSLATAGFYARQAPIWTMPTEILPPGTAGPAMGLVNGIGNLGGFLGPFVMGYLKSSTHSFTTGYYLLGSCMLLGAVFVLLVGDTPHQLRQTRRMISVQPE